MTFKSIFDGGRSARVKVTLGNQAVASLDQSVTLGASVPFTDSLTGNTYTLSVDGSGNAQIVLNNFASTGPISRIEFYQGETINQAQFSYLSVGTSGSLSTLVGNTGSDGNYVDGAHITTTTRTNTNLTPIPATSFGFQVTFLGSESAGTSVTIIRPVIDAPAVIYAPNESLTAAENTPISVTPAITSDGSPVAPTSLAVIAAPVHGNAVVSGSSIIYTPTTGYSGSDSYTYQANVGGVFSNIATVSITIMPIIAASNVSITAEENGTAVSVTPVITSDGTPVAPTSLTILTLPVHGVASVSGASLLYTPNTNYIGSDSFTYKATVSGVDSVAATVSVTVPATYNCECDDAFPTATLAALRQRMVVRLGYAALLVAPPGLVLLLNDFLTQAQTLLYRKYSCFRTRRWFTWNMVQGGRFYDFGGNVDVCAKVLDPRKVEWVGISKGDVNWRELICGINPVNYRSMQQAIPQFYDIRQCIEVWPAPNSNEWQLRIKGDFGLLPFVADTDVTTIDAEAVFLLALANAKAHYEQPDAGTTMAMATGLIADYTAGSHFTRRYVPGTETMPNAVPPLMVP